MEQNDTAPDVGNKDGLAGGDLACPWPESVFPMNDSGYTVAVPSELLRTAISGYLMRKGWNVAIDQTDARVRDLESMLSQCINGLKIIANLEPDPDRCATDAQIARIWLKRAGLWDEPGNGPVVGA